MDNLSIKQKAEVVFEDQPKDTNETRSNQGYLERTKELENQQQLGDRTIKLHDNLPEIPSKTLTNGLVVRDYTNVDGQDMDSREFFEHDLRSVKPPPSYEMVISNNGNILPTYQQVLTTIDKRNDYLIEEENSNSSETIILNINDEQAYKTIVNDNCFCNYLKNYKNNLIRQSPYFISIIAAIIISILRLCNVIDTGTLAVLAFAFMALIAIYGRFESPLVKK